MRACLRCASLGGQIEPVVYQEDMATMLRDDTGAVMGGPAMEEAWARRRLRCRQDLLRRQGLTDVADALTARYHSRARWSGAIPIGLPGGHRHNT